MVETVNPLDVAALPLAPRSPLPYRQRLWATRNYNTGAEFLRDAGGPVTRWNLGPRWLLPTMAVTTSPQGAHDVLDRPGAFVDKQFLVFEEQRNTIGTNLFNLPHESWLPRRRAMQKVFTKTKVARYSEHMAEAAATVFGQCSGGGTVDLDATCRTLTLRALGRSVLGLDLDAHSHDVADAVRTVSLNVSDRSTRPVRAPNWLPTPARRRARAANAILHDLADGILTICQADPLRQAPLVRALIDARDPDSGLPLSDTQIRDELVAFLIAGHDTTSTTLTYALWALGRHPEIQDKVAAETAALGTHQLTAADIADLTYTVQVLHEALRLCPPAAGLGRMALQDIDVDGFRIEAGTWVMVGVYAIQRDPDLWDRSLEFDPDRFGPGTSADRDRWQFIPFGGGPRGCIGSHFAMLEATLALATIIAHHRIESCSADFPLALPFTMVAGAPIPARVFERT